MKKTQEINSHYNRLFLNTVPSEIITLFPSLLQCYYAFTEEILILLFNPLVYGHNDGYCPQKHAPGVIPLNSWTVGNLLEPYLQHKVVERGVRSHNHVQQL